MLSLKSLRGDKEEEVTTNVEPEKITCGVKKTEVIDNTITVYLVGDIDAVTAPALPKALKEVLSKHDNIKEVILNLKEARYLSSAGLRGCVEALNICRDYGINTKDYFKITELSKSVYQIFTVTGFAFSFNLEKAEDDE